MNNRKLVSNTYKLNPQKFPKEVCDYIIEHHKGVGPTEMAQRLNNTFGASYTAKQVNGYYRNHKIKSGVTGRFEKGNTPFNKGKKGCCAPPATKLVLCRGVRK